MTKLRTCPHCGGDLRNVAGDIDSRTKAWRIRLRVYDLTSPSRDDAMEDSAAGYPAEHPGVDVIRGLPAVAEEISLQLHQLHKVGLLRGITPELLAQKVRGVRPTISRRGGSGVIRIDYDTPESPPTDKPRWSARVDIVREEAEQQENQQ